MTSKDPLPGVYTHHDGIEYYNKLLRHLISQARNDYNQAYEVKEGDNEARSNLIKIKPKLSKISEQFIADIDRVSTEIYNELYYAVNESECDCGQPHNHNKYQKFTAMLDNTVLEMKIHYLLEPLTRTQLKWVVLNISPNNTIPAYITIRVSLID
jgi:hypothetical protein